MLKYLKVSFDIVKRFFNDGCTIQAAGLSYVTLLSLVPLMTVSLSVLSAFPSFNGVGEKLQSIIFSNFVGPSANVIQHHFQIFLSQAKNLSILGIFSLLIIAVLMIFSIEQAFNRIWNVKNRRNLLQTFLIYWAVLTFTPVMFGVAFITSSSLIATNIPVDIQYIFPYIFTFVGFMLLYVAVPNCKVKLRFAAVGALISSVLFEIAKAGFAFYLKHFPTYILIYGALASIPIFLVWLYVSWLVILFGAVVSHDLSETSIV